MMYFVNTTQDTWVHALVKHVPYPYQTISYSSLKASVGFLLLLKKIKGGKTLLIAGNKGVWLAPIAKLIGMQVYWFAERNTQTLPRLLKQYISACTQCMVPNQHVAEVLKQYINTDVVSLVYPPTQQTIPKRPRNELRIACDGMYGVAGGIGTVLKAIQYTVDIIDTVKLYVGGSIAERANIEWLCKELGIEEHVQCVPLHTSSWVEVAHVYVLPKYGEQVPLSMLHAMGAGSALVASKGFEDTEFVKKNKNALIFEEDDAEMLSQAFITLIRNPMWILQMGEENTNFTERYLSQKQFLETMGAIRKIA